MSASPFNRPRAVLGALPALLQSPIAGGMILMATAVLALVVANSPAAPLYFSTLSHPVAGLNVLHGTNDALMAFFFFW